MRVNTSNVQKFRVEETEIEEVGSFVYLGSVVSVNGGTEEDVASRIKKANGLFFQLYPVWRNHNISKGLKIRLFNTNVKSLLLYADKITNEELWRITKQKPIEIQIKRRKWNWIGHTLCKEAGAIEKTTLEWNPQGYRRRGRPKRMWRRRK